MPETIYCAILKNDEGTLTIEYSPVVGVYGAIEILSFSFSPRVHDTVFEARQASRRRYKWQPVRPQISEDPRDEI